MWWQPSSPSADLKPIPWLAPDVILYLENIIQPDFEVLEFGAGGSTLWFAERVKTVISEEKNFDWAMAIKKKAPINVSIFYVHHLITPQTRLYYDLLLIDGEPVTKRAKWITDAPQLVKPDGWIVLDNANRPEYAQEREWLGLAADLVQTFNGNQGVTKYLVTEFYRCRA